MKRILCFGDSLTWGFIPGSGKRYDEETRWTRLLQKKLGDEYVVHEDGICGRTTVYDLGRNHYQHGLSGLGYALCSDGPLDLVIIMLGTNDLEYVSVESIGVGMDELVRTTLGANAIYRTSAPTFENDPKILIICPPYIREEIDETLPYNSVYGKAKSMKRLAEIYQNVAKNRNVYFLDSNEFVEASPIDCIHMDDKNHAIFAEAIYQKVKDIFND